MSDLGPLPMVHPRSAPYRAAEMYLQQVVNEWLARHPDLTTAEILLALHTVQGRVIERVVAKERGVT